MGYLKDWPQHLMFPLAIMWRILCVFHPITELKQCVLDVIEPRRRWFAVAGGSDRRHTQRININDRIDLEQERDVVLIDVFEGKRTFLQVSACLVEKALQ